MSSPIQILRSKGVSDDVILNRIRETRPELSNGIQSAIDRQINSSSILNHIDKNNLLGESQNVPQATQPQEEVAQPNYVRLEDSIYVIKPKKDKLLDPGIWEGFREGFGDESSMAILMGGGMTAEERAIRARRQLSFKTRVAKSIGNLLASIPVFTAGGVAGGAAGGAAGGPVGAAIGGGFGGFSLDTAIKTAYDEYLDLIEKDPRFRDASFIEIVQNINKSPVLIESVKSGALGSIEALNPLLGQMAKIPGLKPLLTSTPGKFLQRAVVDKSGKIVKEASKLTKVGQAAAFGTDVATLTVGGAALEGQLPTAEQLVENALVIGGLKLSLGTANKIIRGAKNTGNFGVFRELDAFTRQDLERIDKANPTEVAKIVQEIAARQQKGDVLKEHRDAAREIVAEPLLVNQPSSKLAKPSEMNLKQAFEAFDKGVQWNDKRTLVERVTEAVDKDLTSVKLQTSALDRLYPIKDFMAQSFGVKPAEIEVARIPNNAYIAFRNAEGATRKAQYELETHQFKFGDEQVKVGESLETILKNFNSTTEIQEALLYKAAKRAKSLEETRNIKTGLDIDAAKVIVKEGAAKYEKVSKDLQKYTDNQRQFLVDAGLISRESSRKMADANPDYISFERALSNENVSGLPKTIVGQAVKRIKGVKEGREAPKLKDLLESYYSNTYKFHQLAELNTAIGELLKAAQLTEFGRSKIKRYRPGAKEFKIDPKEIADAYVRDQKARGEIVDQSIVNMIKNLDSDTLSIFRKNSFVPREGILRHFENGKPVYWEVKDRQLWNALSTATNPKEFGLITKVLAAPASTLRAGAILDVRFMVKNPLRDYMGALIFSKYNMSPLSPMKMVMYNVLNSYKGPGSKFIHSLQGVKNFEKLYGDFIKSGGGLSTMQGVDALTFKQQLDNFTKYKKMNPIQFLRRVGEITEEAARLAEFEAALKVEGNTKLGRRLAAFAARDLSIDFAKAGVQGRALNKLVPFFNAQLQGTEKFYREFARNQASSDRLVYNLAAKLILPSLIMAAIHKGDPEIEQLQDQERDFNWIYRNPVTGKLNKIPVPFEPGIVTNGMVRRFVDYVYNKDPKAFDGFIASLIDSAIPGVIPQAGLPVIETITNHNFFRGVPIIPRNLEEGLLSVDQYNNYTSETAKSLGRIMMYMAKHWDALTLNDDKTAQKYIGESKIASPVVIDHFIESWTGGLGKTFRNITDELLRQAGVADKIVRPAEGTLDKYGLNPFSVRYPRASVKSINEFYDNYFFMKKLIGSAKKRVKLQQPEEAKQLFKTFTGLKLDRAYKAISNMQQAINNIYMNPNLTPEEKRTKMDSLYLDMIKFTKEVNKKIDEARKRKR